MPIFSLSFFGFGKKEEEKPFVIDQEHIEKITAEAAAAEEDADETYQPEELTMMLKKAKLAQYREQYLDADKLFHDALGVLSIYEHHKAWAPDKIKKARVWVWDAMAEMNFIRRRFEEAETCYKDAMRGLIDVGYPQNHITYTFS